MRTWGSSLLRKLTGFDGTSFVPRAGGFTESDNALQSLRKAGAKLAIPGIGAINRNAFRYASPGFGLLGGPQPRLGSFNPVLTGWPRRRDG
jgi:hypothetical protein